MRRTYDVLKSARYKMYDSKGRHVYLTVADDPIVGTPLELWVTLPDENKASEQVLKTDITTIAALFTEARQGGVPYSKLFKSMKQTCYSKQSIPHLLLLQLEQHCPLDRAKRLEFEFETESQKEVFDVEV